MFDPNRLQEIAHLARLHIPDDRLEHYVQDITDILGFIEQINATAIDELAPMAHPHDAVQRLREDRLSESDQSAHFAHLNTSMQQGLFSVPQVIEDPDA